PHQCLTCPQVLTLPSSSLQRLTRPTSAPSQVRATRGIRPVIPSLPPEGERYYRVWVSCCLSAAGIGFLGHPVPVGEFNLPHGRPTGNIRTHTGFPRSTCTRPGRGGCRH